MIHGMAGVLVPAMALTGSIWDLDGAAGMAAGGDHPSIILLPGDMEEGIGLMAFTAEICTLTGTYMSIPTIIYTATDEALRQGMVRHMLPGYIIITEPAS